MKQYAFFTPLLGALLMLSACDSSGQNSNPINNDPSANPPAQVTSPTPTASPTATPVVTPTPRPTASPSPTATPSNDQLSVVIQKATNFDSTAMAKLEKARLVLEMVVNSEDFKQKVLHFTYNGAETYVQNNSYTNAQIYDLIKGGAELYPSKTAANHTMDYWVQLYTAVGSSTIGYTSPTYSTIYMNTYFYNSASAAEIAGNMMHEWLHKLGFDHDSSATARRPYSVPYAIGYIARDLAKTLQ